MSRMGTGLANGIRQYAVTLSTAWQQLEAQGGSIVANTGLAPSLPVQRWKGQVGTSSSNYDYTQGAFLQNRDAAATVYVTTWVEADGSSPVGVRLTANSIAIPPGSGISVDGTDLSKVWVCSSVNGTLLAVFAN